MAISFPQSTRVLRNDGIVPVAAALAVAGLLLLLWGAWFVFARVPITVTCAQTEVSRDGTLLARCPPEHLARLRRGATAIVIVNNGGRRDLVEGVVLRGANTRTRTPDLVEVYPLEGEPLPEGAGHAILIEVERLSPLELVLRGGAGPGLSTDGARLP